MERNIYKDIAERTGGDIYIGVVGPVRTGKSTFISKFLSKAVMPTITDQYKRDRIIDDMPQSADGKTIMTTQPRFVPEEGIKLALEGIDAKVRLIDCVGFVVKGAVGQEEDGKPRMVKTPWNEEAIPFQEAAEIGTRKVITDHSTIGIMVTCDGSFTGIPRENYVQAEEETVRELAKTGRPYIIVLNSTHPTAKETVQLAKDLEDKYHAGVITLNAMAMESTDINTILEKVLFEFPVESVDVVFPDWLQALPLENSFILSVVNTLKQHCDDLHKLKDYSIFQNVYENDDNFENLSLDSVVAGEGKIIFKLIPNPKLFYKIISEECGVCIDSDFALMRNIKDLTHAKLEYDRLKDALDEVNERGYGVVVPSMEQMHLETPEVVNRGGKCGVRLKASAPSLHIMKVDIDTEINPVVGTEAQTEELVKYLLSEFESNPKGIWETNMFGKSLNMLVKEGLTNKLLAMPKDTQSKMRRTLSKIINEGKGGMICILL